MLMTLGSFRIHRLLKNYSWSFVCIPICLSRLSCHLSSVPLRAPLKTPHGGKNGRPSKEEPAKRAPMWVALFPLLRIIPDLTHLENNIYLSLMPKNSLVSVFLRACLPLTPARLSSVSLHCCVCVYSCAEMCVFGWINAFTSAGIEMASVHVETHAVSSYETGACVCQS